MKPRNIAPASPEKARALILSGVVLLDSTRVDKAGALVAADAAVTVKGEVSPFVSRGGLKLKGALDHFGLDVQGMAVLDAGASTGGFTDCLLQAGARKVFAADVGYGQLAWKLREDPRVVVIERTIIRHYDGRHLDVKPELAVIDVSFISLKTVIPAVRSLLADHARILALIKPQFEAGRQKVGRNGVVRDPRVHIEVLVHCINAAQGEGLNCIGITYSPIRGPKGNIEYFIHLRLQAEPMFDVQAQATEVVERAQRLLEENWIENTDRK